MLTLGSFMYALRFLSIVAIFAAAVLVRSRNRGSAMSAAFSAGAILLALHDLYYRFAYIVFDAETMAAHRPLLIAANRVSILLMLLAVLPRVGIKKPSVSLRIAAFGFAVLEAARSLQAYEMNNDIYLFLFFTYMTLTALMLVGSFKGGEAAETKPFKAPSPRSSNLSEFSGARWMAQNATPQPNARPATESRQARPSERYDQKLEYREGLAAVKSGDRWGFIDQAGNEVVQPQFVWVSDYSEGFASVCDDSTYQGYIDREGHYLVKPKYGMAKPFRHGLGEVKHDMKYGVVDKTGWEIVPLKYDDVNIYEGGYVITELDNRYGLYDNTGKELLKPLYEEIEIDGPVVAYTENGTKKELKL